MNENEYKQLEEDEKTITDNSDIFKLEWYYIDREEKQPKGPISIRDIDVFMRTNSLDSTSYVWKEGMEDWKRIYQIIELNDIASKTHTEIQESLIRNKIQNAFNNSGLKIENNAIDNYYFGADGLWHVYNRATKTWSEQEKKPETKKISIDYSKEEKEIEEFKVNYNKNDYEEEIKDLYKEIENLDNKENTEVIKDDIVIENISDSISHQNENLNENITFLNKKRKQSESSQSDITITNTLLDKKKKKITKQKEKKKQQWYLPKVNSNVYITNLPKDITEHEIMQYFSRCGFIRKDQRTNQPKIKIYRDQSGKPKGDALVSYLREESVTMAIELLNETEIRPGCKINVDQAKFEQKGNYQERETYKLDYIQRYKLKTDVDRMLGWNEEDEEQGLKIVILKHMFEPVELIEDEGLRQDLELDIVEECETNFGEIDKFMIFEEHPEGIVKIRFKTPAAADKCIQALNNRYYNNKVIEAFYWDGKTDFTKFNEDESTQEKRIEEFGKWLESEPEDKTNK